MTANEKVYFDECLRILSEKGKKIDVESAEIGFVLCDMRNRLKEAIRLWNEGCDRIPDCNQHISLENF